MAPLYYDDLTTVATLKQRSIHGGVAAMVAQICKFALQLASVVVLARLLTPEDYGLFSIVMALTVFVNIFNDLGLTWATIQSPEINHRQVSTLFWINLGLGCILALATGALAPLIARIYHEPRLTLMLIAMAAAYILQGLMSQPGSLLRRQMRFPTIALIEVASMAAGIAIAIIAAIHGARYWSLVFMQLTIAGTNVVGIWLAGRWLPGLPGRISEVRKMLNFGGQLTITSIFTYAIRNLDNLLIGWYWGARSLGYYDKAYQLLLVQWLQVSSPISGIALPVLSRLQADPRRYREYHDKFLMLAAAAGMSLTAFLFVSADKVVLLMLGAQWMPSVPIFRMLAPAAFLGTSIASVNWIFISLGQSARMFHSSVAVAIVTVVGFIIGLPFGAIGVAISFSVTRLILLLPLFVYGCQKSPLIWTRLLRTILRPAFSAIGASIILMLVTRFYTLGQYLFIGLSLSAAIYCMFFLAVWIILPGGWRSFLEIINVILMLKNERGSVVSITP